MADGWVVADGTAADGTKKDGNGTKGMQRKQRKERNTPSIELLLLLGRVDAWGGKKNLEACTANRREVQRYQA